MTPEIVLLELLNRISANKGSPVFISAYELNEWPSDIVACMKASGLIEKGQPAKSVVCPGCEQACLMPINVPFNQSSMLVAFIFCDKRNDTNRVEISHDYIEQWQSSGYLIAKFVSKLLNITHANTTLPNPDQWEIGVIKGAKHAAHITLHIDSEIMLSISGHSILLTEILLFEKDKFKIDKKRLNKLVDNPVGGGGVDQSAKIRKERLLKRKIELQHQGCKNFIEIMAKEEGVSQRRIHQLLQSTE
jgi:hypothetical protein